MGCSVRLRRFGARGGSGEWWAHKARCAQQRSNALYTVLQPAHRPHTRGWRTHAHLVVGAPDVWKVAPAARQRRHKPVGAALGQHPAATRDSTVDQQHTHPASSPSQEGQCPAPQPPTRSSTAPGSALTQGTAWTGARRCGRPWTACWQGPGSPACVFACVCMRVCAPHRVRPQAVHAVQWCSGSQGPQPIRARAYQAVHQSVRDLLAQRALLLRDLRGVHTQPHAWLRSKPTSACTQVSGTGQRLGWQQPGALLLCVPRALPAPCAGAQALHGRRALPC